MPQKIRATYCEGVLIPKTNLNFQENTELDVIILQSQNSASNVLDPEARKQILQSLLTRMRKTSLAAHPHRFVADASE